MSITAAIMTEKKFFPLIINNLGRFDRIIFHTDHKNKYWRHEYRVGAETLLQTDTLVKT
jgi:hypothetical protein